jgi:hypothetical protein
MAHVVKDLVYLDLGETDADPTSVSDTGQGSYPNVTYSDSHVTYRSSATSTVVIPWSRVVKITETRVP